MTELKQDIFGLTSRDISTIHNILQQYSAINKVVIFGSRAKGTYKLGSDIDLAIMESKIDFPLLAKIKNDFSESSLPYFVDIVCFEKIENNQLKEHINRVGILFYEKC